MSYSYTLPDGSDDAPDENGQHTKTVNVRHSALDLARFYGCETCLSIALHERESHDSGNHTDDHGSHSVADCPTGYVPPNWADGKCNCGVCRERRQILGW